ncbi:hypothetical protein NE857_00340 [Nocardiopsis exhalans]|uniref:Uncharacterized protein n=1 Tax=Nocardiopsis exhalans TaxID=163604 RepID=A0ABY5DAB9_9ACTN|nr:hypothetical protein [Nocardiopsis exhalans]USY20168.1 hypothetical protein NE857_00340 [Nocardiopsis exhalans]
MPRRRPGALRAEQPRAESPRSHIRGISSGTCHAIHLIERRSRHPSHSVGFTAIALDKYERFVRTGGQEALYLADAAYECPGCILDDVRHARDLLESVLRRLPKRARTELHRRLTPLDELYLRRTLPNPFADPDDPWWRRRFEAD